MPYDRFRGLDPFSLDKEAHLDWISHGIARRAYRLLDGWTADQVREAAEDVDLMLFDAAHRSEERSDSRTSMLKDNLWRYALDNDELPQAKPHHYFAVLSLGELADAAHCFSGSLDWEPLPMDWPSEAEKVLLTCLVDAADAVACAEGLNFADYAQQQIDRRTRIIASLIGRGRRLQERLNCQWPSILTQ